MTVTRLIARPMLSSIFIVGAANALKNTEAHTAGARKVSEQITPLVKRAAPGVPIPTDSATLVRINAATQIVAALGLATGRAPRVCATVLAASLVPTTLAGHRFWEETEPEAKAAQRLHFVKNTSILGGLLLAGVDTDAKPGVAWRTRRAASDVRREARHLAKGARREAKLARAQLS